MNTRQLLETLVGFPTVSDQPTTELINWVTTYFRACGADVEIIAAQEGSKAGLWARLGPATKGGVVLAGHVDVVPTDGQVWTTDPFTLAERDGNLFGRGTCDMKGFLACALSFAGRIAPDTLQKPVYIALTYDEETTMAGAVALSKWLIDKNVQADWVWLGEPTGLEIVTAHKGVVCFETTITGVAGHASLPDKGLMPLLWPTRSSVGLLSKARFLPTNHLQARLSIRPTPQQM